MEQIEKTYIVVIEPESFNITQNKGFFNEFGFVISSQSQVFRDLMRQLVKKCHSVRMKYFSPKILTDIRKNLRDLGRKSLKSDRDTLKWLGYKEPPIKVDNYYELHAVPETTLEELSRYILQKIKPLGQESIQIIGDIDKKISKITLGTGAATHYREMHALGGDAIILSDDGTYLWESGQWAKETGVPIIIVNHSLSEEPGMGTLGKYLEKAFPEVPVYHIPVGCIFKCIY